MSFCVSRQKKYTCYSIKPIIFLKYFFNNLVNKNKKKDEYKLCFKYLCHYLIPQQHR